MMREWVSWFNDEITQLWPVLLVIGPLTYKWWRTREEARRAEREARIKREAMEFVGAAIAEATAKAASAHSEDIGVIKEQVANSHTTNLRYDIDALHEDVRVALKVNKQYLNWSQEWTARIERQVEAGADAIADLEARVHALELVAANPTPPP